MRKSLAPTPSTTPLDLEAFIEAFETAQVRSGQARVDEFLPDKGHPHYRDIVLELLCVDLEYRWRRGTQPGLNEYQAAFPDILSDPRNLKIVAFEEYRQRCQAGAPVDPQEYGRRYGIATSDWPTRRASNSRGPDDTSVLANDVTLDSMRGDTDRLTEAVQDFPDTGGRFLQFQILEQLGRGSFARVYLARQDELAGRRVVLKISPEFSWEAHRLAQLQHTNIVPIHSVHRDGELQAVCMPFFGRTTLSDVVQPEAQRDSLPMSGRQLLDFTAGHPAALEKDSTVEPDTGKLPREEVATSEEESLARFGPVEACLWIASKLADALAHAHARGILHRDLKPANILLTDDGQPMILDFNLSDDIVSGGRTCLMVGGTLPYMAPEHLRAIESGEPVDERADIYSLGVILFEMLTGQLPFPNRQGAIGQVICEMIADRQRTPSVRGVNRAIPRCVDSIVGRCLEPNPDRRYGSARQLHEDLRRQLDDLPLRYAPDRSVVERTGKWCRRHPTLTSATTIALIAIFGLATMVGMWGLRGRQIARLQAAAQFQRLHEQTSVARAMLSLPDPASPALTEGVELAHSILRQYRLPDAGDWQQESAYRLLERDQQRQVARDLGGVLYLLARLAAREAPELGGKPEEQDPLQEALRLNDLARQMYEPGPAPRAIQLQRADLLDAKGQSDPAERIRSVAMRQPPGDAMDQFLLAVQMLGQGQYEEATSWLQKARRELPRDYSVWLLLGNSLAGLGQRHEAEGCYTTCVTLWPDCYLGFFQRGLCRFELGKHKESKQDFDNALRLRPHLPTAMVNRALAYQAMGKLQDAVRDLTLAFEAGATETRIYFIRSRIRQQLGDLAGARQDRVEGLRRQPSDEKSWIARGIARLSTDPRAALEDFRHALRLNPRSQPARQNVAHVLSERMDQTEAAIEILDESLEIKPDAPAVLVARGVLYARLGDREAAIGDAQRALRLEAAIDLRHQIQYQAGCIYALTSKQTPGDAKTAIALVGQAIRFEPKWFNVAATDPDLNSLRTNEEFRTILSAVNTLDKHTPDI